METIKFPKLIKQNNIKIKNNMGLVLATYKLHKLNNEEISTGDYLELTDDDGCNIKNIPENINNLCDNVYFDFYDWNKFYEETGIDIDKCEYIEKNNHRYLYKNNVLIKEIDLNDIPTYKEETKIIGYKVVGYQEYGFNDKFYDDYDNNKISNFLWTLDELKEYQNKYAKDKEEFQQDIIDNFKEGECCLYISW